MSRRKVSDLTENELARILTYAGYVLLSYELTKSMIVEPIRAFYDKVDFINSSFKSYSEDVLSLHKNEFEACLIYLKDFMQVIDSKDILAVQSLRKHRNDLAHNLPDRLSLDEIDKNFGLLENVKQLIFKLSNYRAYMEIGQEPELRNINWDLVKGGEYLLLEAILEKVQFLNSPK